MLEECYKEYICETTEPNYDYTLVIPNTLKGRIKIKRSWIDQEKEKAKEDNNAIELERENEAGRIAAKVASFKRDFLGAPIRAAMKASLAGKEFSPCEIPYRQDEKYYVFADDLSI